MFGKIFKRKNDFAVCIDRAYLDDFMNVLRKEVYYIYLDDDKIYLGLSTTMNKKELISLIDTNFNITKIGIVANTILVCVEKEEGWVELGDSFD